MEPTGDKSDYLLQQAVVQIDPREEGMRPENAEEVQEQEIFRTDQNFRKLLIRFFCKHIETFKILFFERLNEEETQAYEKKYKLLSSEKKVQQKEKIEKEIKEVKEGDFAKKKLDDISQLSFIETYSAVYNLHSTRLALKKIEGGLSRKKGKKSDSQGVRNTTLNNLFAENKDIILTKRNERNRHVLKNIIRVQYYDLIRESKLKSKNYSKNMAYLIQVLCKLDGDGNFFKDFKLYT